MLKRLYVDNFRSLVNFDLEFNGLTLLLGPNGSGKTSALEVIRRLREFVCEQKTAGDLFPCGTLTRWQESQVQTFEIGLSGNGGEYKYRLEVEQEVSKQRCRVKAESLFFDDKPLFESKLKDRELRAQLYRDGPGKGPEVLVDWTRSGVGFIQERPENQRLAWFRKSLKKVHVCRFDPMVMSARAEQESEVLAWNAANFVEWFRHAVSVDLELATKLRSTLEDALSGFDGLSLVPDGVEAKLLKVKFRAAGSSESQSSSAYDCRFDELSDGQRILLVLHALLAAADSESTLCLDEPENFLALAEVQPWLNEFIDRTQRQSFQGILISHHPHMIDALAAGCGRWLDRTAGGPTRTQAVGRDGSGLSVSELVSRGWLHA